MPLALLAIGSCLDPKQFSVRIIDARLEKDPLAAVLAEIDDALCFATTVLTGAPILDALKVTRAVKARRPELPTIWGGWHTSLFPLETLAEPSIDITVQGQGEATFAEIIQRLLNNEDLQGLQGIGYRQQGQPKQNPPRPLQDMDDFPPPDFNLIQVERYFQLKGKRQLDYIASTGCPFRCAFCADPYVYGRNWKGVAPTRLGSEIEMLWRRYRFEDLNFQDETFFTYQKRVAAIAEEFLQRDVHFSWAATLRADQGTRLPEEVFKLCKRSGLRRVLIGVESGSPHIIKMITKDTRLEQILTSAELCVRHDVAVIFSFIVGFPGETTDDVQATLDLVKKLRAMSPKFETPIFYYKPYPGSQLTIQGTDDDSMPQTLMEWAEFDYVDGDTGPWVSAETYRRVERFKFYNRFAWGAETWQHWPLQKLARLRCQYDAYQWPIEKLVMDRISPPPALS